LAIGIITSPRPEIDVRDAIDQLRKAGFGEPIHLFCEPGMELDPLPDVTLHRNEKQLGVLGNWRHCLEWLFTETTADYLMVGEDDVRYCRGARTAWEAAAALHERDHVGFWSLYTPVRDRHHVGDERGWSACNRGRDAWGTQAMCFPRESAQIL